ADPAGLGRPAARPHRAATTRADAGGRARDGAAATRRSGDHAEAAWTCSSGLHPDPLPAPFAGQPAGHDQLSRGRGMDFVAGLDHPMFVVTAAALFGARTGDEVDKFTRCRWTSGPAGVPLLDDC